MRIPRCSYVFMLLTLLCLCITSCADTQSSASTTANVSNQSATLASFSQEEFFTGSTPSLVVYPSQLNEQNCQTSNNQTWTCIVTLYGENIVNTVAWSAYTSNSSISINPGKGYLAQVADIVKVTISNIQCTNASFLFSGQVLGGGGVIPTTITWSCIPQPTPTPTPRPTSIPTHQPTSIPTHQPSPTPKTTVPTSTPVATVIPRTTPMSIAVLN